MKRGSSIETLWRVKGCRRELPLVTQIRMTRHDSLGQPFLSKCVRWFQQKQNDLPPIVGCNGGGCRCRRCCRRRRFRSRCSWPMRWCCSSGCVAPFSGRALGHRPADNQHSQQQQQPLLSCRHHPLHVVSRFPSVDVFSMFWRCPFFWNFFFLASSNFFFS